LDSDYCSIFFYSDCGLNTCAFTEFVCWGDMNISTSIFYAADFHWRYEALLWIYEKRKIDTDTVSESESTESGGQLIQKGRDWKEHVMLRKNFIKYGYWIVVLCKMLLLHFWISD